IEFHPGINRQIRARARRSDVQKKEMTVVPNSNGSFRGKVGTAIRGDRSRKAQMSRVNHRAHVRSKNYGTIRLACHLLMLPCGITGCPEPSAMRSIIEIRNLLPISLLLAALGPGTAQTKPGWSHQEFLSKLSTAAIERTHHSVRYVSDYVRIPYPGGDVPA